MRLYASILIATGLGLVGLPVQAATGKQCAAMDAVANQLDAKYSEAPVAAGLTHDGRLLQVYATNDGETWTIVLSKPDGSSCVTMAGEGWQPMRHKNELGGHAPEA